ncbi:MAG: tetratricopeptide repeat protein, partial [Alphaproteobacteria bacterium]|nr:tetratricopeptide repeat protein [Alphaproteobacteria bacterium]
MEDGKQNNLFAHIQTVLIGAVGLGVLAGTYAVVDLIDPDASPYAHTAITGALALALLGAGWLAVKAGRETYARWALARLPVASSARLSIVVATLKGDKGGERSHRVTLSLRDQLGERVQVLPIGITVLHAYPYDDRQRQTAMKVVRRILEQTQADLLIWGTTHTAEKVIDLNFAARQTAHASSQSYALDTTLRLPENFGGDLGAALAAIAATSAAPAVDNAGKFLVPILEPVVSRLSHFIGNPPATLTGDSRADVFHAYALACARLGEQKGDSSFLLAAVTAYREALKECTRERVPLPWATTQNNLGNALRSLGERESGTARLEEAVTAYREALKERTRERVPLDWAMT